MRPSGPFYRDPFYLLPVAGLGLLLIAVLISTWSSWGLGSSTPAQASAIGDAATFAGVSALAAIITAIVAVWALVNQARDSRDRSRPLVTAAFRPGPSFTHGMLYLVIKNAGASVARDIAIGFDPEIERNAPSGRPRRTAEHIPMRYAKPVPVLAAGETLANIYVHMANDEEEMPRQLKVSVAYADDRGRPYSGSFELDADLYGSATSANPGGSDYDKRSAQGIEALGWELWHGRI